MILLFENMNNKHVYKKHIKKKQLYNFKKIIIYEK